MQTLALPLLSWFSYFGTMASFRDMVGVTDAVLSTLYTAALAAYPVALKGPYTINGVSYSPPSPDEILEQIKILGGEQARRGISLDPLAPALASFGDAAPTGTSPFNQQ